MHDTPTATDALLERKKILEENAELIRQRDVVRRELSEAEVCLENTKRDTRKAEAEHIKVKARHDKGITDIIDEKLRHRKEIGRLEMRVAMLKPIVEGFEARKPSLEAEMARLEGIIGNLQTDGDQKALDHAQKGKKHDREQDVRDALIRELDAKIDSAKAELDRVQKEAIAIEQKHQDEDRRLATKEIDLGIYENRIREAAEKLNPPMNIIL